MQATVWEPSIYTDATLMIDICWPSTFTSHARTIYQLQRLKTFADDWHVYAQIKHSISYWELWVPSWHLHSVIRKGSFFGSWLSLLPWHSPWLCPQKGFQSYQQHNDISHLSGIAQLCIYLFVVSSKKWRWFQYQIKLYFETLGTKTRRKLKRLLKSWCLSELTIDLRWQSYT